MSDSVCPQRGPPIRLSRPWDSPGKNTGVGCHFLLQCVKVKSEREVAQSGPTLSDPMDCSLPGSFVHEIFQARVLEWGAITYSVYPTPFPTPPSEISRAQVSVEFLFQQSLWKGEPFHLRRGTFQTLGISNLPISDSLQPYGL